MKEKKVLLLLAKGFEVLEASAFIDVFGWDREEGSGNIVLETCAFEKEVETAFGQTWKSDCLLANVSVKEYEALFIPGGFETFGFYEEAFSDEFSNLIKSFHQENKLIATVCVGALAVAKSGILKNVAATTYQKNPLRLQQLESYEVKLKKQEIVVANNIITSSGPSTAMQVAFLCLEQLSSKANADKIKYLMGF